MIQVRDLRKNFGDVKAVAGVSFEVGQGEVFGLLGPNGAGKTTTISILSTLLPADGGSARVCGHDVAAESHAVRRRIGVVPQELAVYEELTAAQNLDVFGRLYGLSGDGLKRRVGELLELAELSEHANRPVKGFSGGMKRRLNIMVGLVHAPDVLFLDEPTVGIDAQARTRILDLIGQMNRDGLTVLYTTHYLEEAEHLCDRIGVIDHGELVALGSKEELIGQIGEQDTVRVAAPPALWEELLQAAASWEDVTAAGIHRGKVQFQCLDGASLLPLLGRWLAERGLGLHQLEVIRPDLESLYLKITGRALRE
ncbi:MAG TPA: ABC transporter ATP-binding protein [Candidatus Krumholzibacteria bacterium]|nr:ABC transporter ATP-binding protein [Candidatus Krumholzibacteria bacterium]HRX50681.1 ABC transporter ATP-binding protein [Candidatus Krumholzibacteria bacterium]